MIGIAQQKYILVPIYFPIISLPCNFFSRAIDYKITPVFRLKAQSRAMGNTADT